MLELTVSGMGCGSCVAQITRAIRGLDDAARVAVNRAEGRVSGATTESAEAVCQLISELGYPAAPLR
jgi:copper chaperone